MFLLICGPLNDASSISSFSVSVMIYGSVTGYNIERGILARCWYPATCTERLRMTTRGCSVHARASVKIRFWHIPVTDILLQQQTFSVLFPAFLSYPRSFMRSHFYFLLAMVPFLALSCDKHFCISTHFISNSPSFPTLFISVLCSTTIFVQ